MGTTFMVGDGLQTTVPILHPTVKVPEAKKVTARSF